MNNDVVMIRAYLGGRWFFYTFFLIFNIILIIGAFKFEFRRKETIEIGKFFIAMNLVTVYVIYILEAFKIQYNQTFFSYRSSFQRHYRDISYSQIERLWIEFERKPFQALDTLKVRLKDGRIIKITRTAFPQPAYRNFEQMLQERTGLKIKGHSPLVAKP